MCLSFKIRRKVRKSFADEEKANLLWVNLQLSSGESYEWRENPCWPLSSIQDQIVTDTVNYGGILSPWLTTLPIYPPTLL